MSRPYVVESPEILIGKLLSIRIEREKCVKASKHAKNMFLTKKCIFFTQISERSTCTHLHHSDLDSGGQRYQNNKSIGEKKVYFKTHPYL